MITTRTIDKNTLFQLLNTFPEAEISYLVMHYWYTLYGKTVKDQPEDTPVVD